MLTYKELMKMSTPICKSTISHIAESETNPFRQGDIVAIGPWVEVLYKEHIGLPYMVYAISLECIAPRLSSLASNKDQHYKSKITRGCYRYWPRFYLIYRPKTEQEVNKLIQSKI